MNCCYKCRYCVQEPHGFKCIKLGYYIHFPAEEGRLCRMFKRKESGDDKKPCN